MERSEIILYGLAGLFLLYEIVSGWRAGIVRQLVTLAALAAGYFAGVAFGGAVAPFLRFTGFPDFILKPVASVVVGIMAYLLVSFFGKVLFRRTADQGAGLIWLFYGVTGAFIGAVYGVLLLLGAAIAIRSLGALATGITSVSPPPAESAAPGEPPPLPSRPNRVATALASLKQTLDKSAAGELLALADPVSPETYALMEKTGRVAADPAALFRLLDYPGMKELAQRPEIQALRDDPDIATAAREGKLTALLKNPKLVKTANDPKVAEQAKRFDLGKALDFALEK